MGRRAKQKRGAIAMLLALFVLFCDSVVRKLVATVASTLVERLAELVPALLHGDYRVARAEFVFQLAAASWTLYLSRKGRWSLAKLFVCAYAGAVIAYYMVPTWAPIPVPIIEVTGQQLCESSFLVMSWCLLCLSDSRSHPAAPSPWTLCTGGVLILVQLLAVTGTIETGALTLTVSAIGVTSAVRFAYAMNDVISPVAAVAFWVYSATLPLRLEALGSASHLTGWYYGLMLLKWVAMFEIAGMLTTRTTLTPRNHDGWTNMFRRVTATISQRQR